MARTTTAPTALSRQGVVVVAGAADVAFAASDNVNGNQVALTGREVLLVRNDDVAEQTITITALTDGYGRSGAITTYALAADDVAIFGPFELAGWQQSDDYLYIDTSDADVKLAAFTLPL